MRRMSIFSFSLSLSLSVLSHVRFSDGHLYADASLLVVGIAGIQLDEFRPVKF